MLCDITLEALNLLWWRSDTIEVSSCSKQGFFVPPRESAVKQHRPAQTSRSSISSVGPEEPMGRWGEKIFLKYG